MPRFYVVCPRCSYEVDFAPTKIKVGDLVECLKCKILIKVTTMSLPENTDEEFDAELGVEPLITNGIEIESYLIKNFEILERKFIKPRKGAVEEGEEFTDDITIGNEYISPVFDDINEGFFLLKNGLRKYRTFTDSGMDYQIGLFGTWFKDPAGVHIHIGLGEEGIQKKEASPLMEYLHDYLPFIITLCANSPVYSGENGEPQLTPNASNRMLLFGKEHCKSISKKEIKLMKDDHWNEINYNAVRKEKPPTIEIRVADSNIPEFIIAATAVVRVLTIASICGKPSPNKLSVKLYEESKLNAAKFGVKASLYWNDERVSMGQYIDKFFDFFHDEIEQEDLAGEILDVFRWAKLGWNNAVIIRKGIENVKALYKSKKFNWVKQFLTRYSEALAALLDGNNLIEYARQLYVDLPEIEDVQLGEKDPL